MKIELRPLSRKMLRALYRWEMVPAFPRSERRPLGNILRMCRRGDYDVLGAFCGAEVLGLALLWRGEGCVLLDYLLICAGKRGRGLGTAVLEALQARYAGVPVLLAEVEAPVPGGPEEEGQRRRLDFYRRCGFVPLGYQARIFGVDYVMLGLWTGRAEPELAMEGHRALYRSQLPPAMFRHFIHIPKTEGT